MFVCLFADVTHNAWIYLFCVQLVLFVYGAVIKIACGIDKCLMEANYV